MAGQSSTFRKVSLDRLSSPEQLDQRLTVVSPIHWLALASLAVLIIAAIIWGFFGSISEKVSGGGVLWYKDGVVAITTQSGGQITDISVREGDYVEKGQVIARVSQDDLISQIERCRENLAALDAITVETLDLDVNSLNSEIYPEFSQLAEQVRLARVQFEAQKNEADKGEQDVSNQRALQAQQVSSLEKQIGTLEEQIARYKELLDYQREVELENAEARDNQQAQTSGGALYVSDRGNYYRRNFRAAHQLMAMDQTGAVYIILSENTDDEAYPVFYIDGSGSEVYNSEGEFYLPNYYDSLYGSGNYTAIPSRSSRKTVYYDTVTGSRYIDLTGIEFRLIAGNDVPSAYDQTLNRPDYDANLASMESQLENYRLQLIQAQMQSAQLDSAFTAYMNGGYIQTGEQISSLTEQFAQLKQIKQQDLLKSLRDMQSRLEQDGIISAVFDGVISSLNIQRYDYVQPGSTLGNIIRKGAASENVTVVIYVPMDKGKLIHKGMEVNVTPATVKSEEHGYMTGLVKSVSEYAVTQESMMATLRNTQLVQAFGGESAVIKVEIELMRNADTVSGYQWSTPGGAPFTIDAGTICMGEIKVSARRPVDMIVPFIKKLFK